MEECIFRPNRYRTDNPEGKAVKSIQKSKPKKISVEEGVERSQNIKMPANSHTFIVKVHGSQLSITNLL